MIEGAGSVCGRAGAENAAGTTLDDFAGRSLNSASWNRLDGWLRQVERLRRVA